MMSKTLALAAFLLVFSYVSSASARPFTRDCPSHADPNFREVINFLDLHMDDVRTIYESNHNYHSRRGANRRVKRRLGRDRKLGNLWFACASNSAPLCNDSSGRHAFGAASNKIRICYTKVRTQTLSTPGHGFCRLVGLVSHEFGHAVGIKKDKVGLHSKNKSDRVYQWGFAWADFCSSGGFDHDLH